MNNKSDFDAIAFNSISILLVDDNKVNQFLGKKILKNLGILNVDIANDGISALEILQQKNFDVLLTDVEMPGMNGIELTTAVRNLKSDKNTITIIALTANATAEEKEFAIKNGMNDYLSKPYSPSELQHVLQKHLKRGTGFLGFEHSEFTVKNTNPVKGLYTLFNQSKADVKSLLLLLKAQLPESMEIIKLGILNDNYREIFNSAHKLKSTIKIFQDDKLFQCISDITEHARSLQNLEKIPSLYDELNTGVNSIMVLINSEIESI